MQIQSSHEWTIPYNQPKNEQYLPKELHGVIFIFEMKRSFTLGTEFHQTSLDYKEANLYR